MRTETDIELCRVTNLTAKNKIMYTLMQKGIAYAEEWEKVPLVKRKKFHGAKEVCVVITHKANEQTAKAIITSLGEEILGGIVW